MRCATCGQKVSFKEAYLSSGLGGAACPNGHANELTPSSKVVALVAALIMFFVSDFLLKPVIPGHWRFLPNAACLIVTHILVTAAAGRLKRREEPTTSSPG